MAAARSRQSLVRSRPEVRLSGLLRVSSSALCALALLASAARAQSDRSAETFQLGLGLLQRGLHDEAARHFAQFVREQPRHALAAEAHYRLGCCQLELQQADAAIVSLQKALAGGEAFKLRAECQYRLAGALHAGGKNARALEQLMALLAETPADHYLRASAEYARGEALVELQRDADAIPAFLAAAAAGKDGDGLRLAGRYQAGFACLRRGEYDRAAEAFRAAAEGDPAHESHGECWYLAGDACFRAGRHADAVAAFERSCKAGGEFADDATVGLAWSQLKTGDAAAARKSFELAATTSDDAALAARARLEWGRLLQQGDAHARAETVLAPLLGEATPPAIRAEASEIVGLAAAARGDQAGAVDRLAAALASAEVSARPRIQVALGAAHAAAGAWQAALDAYDAAGKDAGQDRGLRGEALYGRALALHKLGRFDESIVPADELRRELPDHPLVEHAALAIAECHFAMKRYAQADAAFAPLAASGAKFAATASFKRAWCSYLQGRPADAAAAFAAIAADRNAEHAEEALSMEALCWFEHDDTDKALAAADRYRARHREGRFLARTERLASRSLQAKGDLVGAARRLASAAAAEGSGGRQRQDHLEAAELFFKQGDFVVAARAYVALAEGDDPVAARALEGVAWCAFELGDDPGALASTDRALAHKELGARRPDVLQLRCAIQQRMQRWADAAATAIEFVRDHGADPRAADMGYALGVAQARGGDDAAARATLAALLQAGGGSRPDRVAYELAWACRRSGDEPGALAAFGQVVAHSSDPELAGEARLHVGEAALARGERDGARTVLTEVRGEHRARALYKLAFDLLGQGEPAAARVLLTQIADEQLRGEFADDARFLLGEACYQAGDHAASTAAAEAALRALPAHTRAGLARQHGAESAVLTGRTDLAVGWLEELLRQDVGDDAETRVRQARAQLWLGRAQAERKARPAASRALQAVTALTDTELAAEAQFRLGSVRRAQGDLDGAVDAFVKLSILYGHADWVARGLFEAAACYQELGQAAKAARFLAELEQRFPESPWAIKAKTAGGKQEGGR